MADKISISLPKGEAMAALAKHFATIGFPVKDYNAKNRTYRPEIKDLQVRAKIMAEKDVAIQVAVGNYDIGFCGMDWIQELRVRYRGTKLHVFKQLELNRKNLYACTSLKGKLQSIRDLTAKHDFVTIISEYPNLAEDFAIRHRLKKFKIFSAWGRAEAYPPEHADVVILAAYNENTLNRIGLHKISRESESALCIVINRKSFLEKDLSHVLQFFSEQTEMNNDTQ
ncbi:ATP phosphoribosyltransferase [Desulfococcaceae bacterium HSG9]|nr:ATP phosphoribosyltransferase [Desulfococcaceae bacterium HSG9]